MSVEHELCFHCMGSDVRLLVGPPLLRSDPEPAQVLIRERAFIEDFAACLSRFSPHSELCELNADERVVVPASALMRSAMRAGIWAARHSGGLVDPTILPALRRAGYETSLDGVTPASLREALMFAPARKPARADPARRWAEIAVDDASATICRPVDIEIDTGGTGKGLCADAVAHRLARYTRFVIDCGGDIAIGGVGAQIEPYEVEIEHPLSGKVIGTVEISAGGVATSGLNMRLWRRGEREFAHHLLDPSTGEPAWTGLIGATALGTSALEAETLSKTALLLGPLRARRVLAVHGGLIVHEDGAVEWIGRAGGLLGVRGSAA